MRADRILGVDRDGAFARYLVVPETVVWQNDRSKLPPEIATLQEPFGNAVFATSEQDLAGRSVAVLGCGPIGLFTIAIARASGAAVVLASDRTPFRLALAEAMGAHATVNVEDADAADWFRDRHEGLGFDVVFEMSGAARAIADAFRIARNGGRVLLFGIPSRPVEIDVAESLIFKNLDVLAVNGRRIFATWYKTRWLLESGVVDLRPLITDEISLDGFEQAFEKLEAGEACKIVVYPGGPRPAVEARQEPACDDIGRGGGRTVSPPNELDRGIAAELDGLREAGTYKRFNTLLSPQGPVVEMEGRGEILVLSSNNYLGLAARPEVVEAGIEGLRRYGAGTASVRFICGTFEVHHSLERELASLVGTEAALTYVSCWNANEAVVPTLTDANTVILSDELNHASLIDAIRLSRPARKLVYKHSSMDELREGLASCERGQRKLVITDGVFSMEGDLARLDDILELAREHEAVVLVDDSHGTGVMGKTGRGVAEHFGLLGEVDVITSTLGKALGGAAGGFVAASEEVCDLLAQRSRPQLFSNALPPTVALLRARGCARAAPRARARRPLRSITEPSAPACARSASRRSTARARSSRSSSARPPSRSASASGSSSRASSSPVRLPRGARGHRADQAADVGGARGRAPRPGARRVRACRPRPRARLTRCAPSRSGDSVFGAAGRSCSPTSASMSLPAASPGCSAPTAPASRRSFAASSECRSWRRAASRCSASPRAPLRSGRASVT